MNGVVVRDILSARFCFLALLIAGMELAAPARAADASCKKLFKARSLNSENRVKIRFMNNSPMTRGLLWLDFTGQPKDMATLAPGQTAEFDTYLTHPWMITDGPGNCVAIVMPRRDGAVVKIAAFGEPGRSGEEGNPMTSCPPGTVPVQETDNCVRPRAEKAETGSENVLPMPGRSFGGIVRSKPDMGSARLDSLQEGDRIEILQDTGAKMDVYAWFKIRYRGRTGYQWGGIMCSAKPLAGILSTCK